MKMLVCLVVVLCMVGVADAVVHTDDFTYGDGFLSNNPDWSRRGDKNTWVVSSNTAVPEVTGSFAPQGIWYDGAIHTTESYQRASADFSFNSSMANYGGNLYIMLDQDKGNSGYYLDGASYQLNIRGKNDMWISRTGDQGAAGTGGLVWGWEGNPVNPQYDAFATPLSPDTVYTMELEKNGSVITGTVYQGVTIVGQASYDESIGAHTARPAGQAAFGAMYTGSSHGYVVDNFEYELVPEPATLALLGMGGLALIRRKK